MKTIRIGSGAGYGGDRLEPALELIEKGHIDYIGFECLAERTIALAQKEKRLNPLGGYNHLFEYRMQQALPLAWKHGVKIITNMGAANPVGAQEKAVEIAKSLGLKGMRIAAVTGDDLFGSINRYLEAGIMENDASLSSIKDQIISANAYLGVGPIVKALEEGADVIITGRVADMKDVDLLGKGTLVGHSLECAGQVSGGYFADPGKKDVPELWNVGFPLAEVDENGNGFITKVEGSGGTISRATCTEQLIYEIHDPAAYITPDCVADFSRVQFSELDTDKVQFTGASGHVPTDLYKVSVGYMNGFIGEGQISYGGHNNLKRAQLAEEIVTKRLEHQQITGIHVDYIGINSLSPRSELTENQEVRLRFAKKTPDKWEAELVANEVEALYTNGPAGGGGAMKSVSEVVSVVSILVPKTDISTSVIQKIV